jgi:hypothetical protein
MEASGVRIDHPNRDKPESKATKAAVTLLLLTSAGLTAVITFGGWDALQGAVPGAIAYILLYAVMAYYVTRWNRGVLPVAAALAVLFMVIAIVAAPGWFERDKEGFEDPALAPGILGLLTLILIPVQLLLIAFALRGFNQEWNVEVEVGGGESDEEREAREQREERARRAREQRKQTAMPWELQKQKEQELRDEQQKHQGSGPSSGGPQQPPPQS